MGMSATSIVDILDGESRSANFKLLFAVWLSRKKISTSFSLRHKLKLSEYIASIPSCFGTALATNCQFFRAMFWFFFFI